ncbi:Uncharacterised protein [Bordetella pertussis]|nr:Uncharacterised protein [Bordetella pertussis]
MVRARESAAVAFLVGAQLVAPVRTLVQQQADLAVPVPQQQHGRRADALGHVVVLVGHFADVTHVYPGPVPDLVQLLLEDLRIDVQAAIDPRGLDQRPVVDLVPDERHRPHLRWFVNYLIIRMIVRFINEEAAACQAQIFITNRLFGFYNNFQESNQGKPLGRFLKITLKENISN